MGAATKRRGAKVSESDGAAMSQAEVAEALGITRGGVSMIEANALRKLRKAIAAHPPTCDCDFCERMPR